MDVAEDRENDVRPPAGRVVPALLLLFVAVSVGWAVFGPSQQQRPPSSPDGSTPVSATTPHTAPRVVAYYFHSDRRCETCVAIERQARDALSADGAFADALAGGALEFRVVNTDRPENAHHVEEFELAFGTLLLAEETDEDGAPGRWLNLSRVWELVGDAEEYRTYVQDAVREALAGRW